MNDNRSTTEQEAGVQPFREAILPLKLAARRQKLAQKAKQEPKFRFYSLYGGVMDKDTLSALRPLGIPTVKDRVVQMAVLLILEPIFEADFEDCSYGFRPGRNAHQALEEIRQQLLAGKTIVYDADLKGYFDCDPARQTHGVRANAGDRRIGAYWKDAFDEIHLHVLTRFRNHLRHRSQRPYKVPAGCTLYAHLRALGLQPLRGHVSAK